MAKKRTRKRCRVIAFPNQGRRKICWSSTGKIISNTKAGRKRKKRRR